MWYFLLACVLLVFLIYLAAATIYLLFLALAFFVIRERPQGSHEPFNTFAILVPAHNEEMLVENLCKSLLQIDYPKDKYEIYVIADNCNDRTAEVCRRFAVSVLERKEPLQRGKGYALDWGLRQIPLEKFNAVFMVDADNYVDAGILKELGKLLNQNEQAIQCYNAVGNRDDSWFTQLLYVSRTIGNQLYHAAKYKLGLSSYLMGNGLCFKTDLLINRGWTAFSAGEDWEYYAQLVETNISIAFASKAKVFHQESRSLNQATSQRLRWSRGRFGVLRGYGLRLFTRGLREMNWRLIDASLPLIFPNYSLQINLTLVSLVFSFLLPQNTIKYFFIGCFLVLICGQLLLFLAGSIIAGSPLKIFIAALYAPVFLLWKSVIDLICITGLYRGKKWVRTKRHQL